MVGIKWSHISQVLMLCLKRVHFVLQWLFFIYSTMFPPPFTLTHSKAEKLTPIILTYTPFFCFWQQNHLQFRMSLGPSKLLPICSAKPKGSQAPGEIMMVKGQRTPPTLPRAIFLLASNTAQKGTQRGAQSHSTDSANCTFGLKTRSRKGIAVNQALP